MELDDWFWVGPLTASEIDLRQALALSELEEELSDCWVEHQDWCAIVQLADECTCGLAANVWFLGPTRVVGVGIDRQPHIFTKH